MIEFNPKQAEFVRLFKRGDLKRLNLLEGAVRSGKTWVTLVVWPLWVAAMPRDEPFLMAGRTLKTLERNLLAPLQKLVGSEAFQFSASPSVKQGALFGRTVYFEGADNALAEGKLRGATFAGALIDEVTTLDEAFFAQVLARLSVPGARLFGTTNPDNPRHWLKKNYLDRAAELDLLAMKFRFDDNPRLPREYLESLKREYTGVFYRRFILGEWCAAEGAVYPQFDPKRHVVSLLPPLRLHWVGVDYGHSNPTVFLLAGLGSDGRLYVACEDYHEAAAEGDRSPSWYSRAMVGFLRRHGEGLNLSGIAVDPSAKGFITQLREDGVARVVGADNDVLARIQLISSMFSRDLIRIHSSCVRLIDELQGYGWDLKAQERGEDRPLKQDDHGPDALGYLIMSEKDEWKRRVSNA